MSFCAKISNFCCAGKYERERLQQQVADQKSEIGDLRRQNVESDQKNKALSAALERSQAELKRALSAAAPLANRDVADITPSSDVRDERDAPMPVGMSVAVGVSLVSAAACVGATAFAVSASPIAAGCAAAFALHKMLFSVY